MVAGAFLGADFLVCRQAVMSNDANLEQLCLDAGLQSGEHMVPMAWLPEALGSAMSSPVADM